VDTYQKYKIIVINLQRTGDIIQSFHILYSLKKSYPNSEIFYLTNNIHSASLSIISEDIKGMFSIDYNLLYQNIITNRNITDAFLYLKNFIKELNNFQFKKLININFSLLSAILSNMIDADEKIGAILERDNCIKIENGYLKKLFCNLENKNFQANIVEYFLKGLKITYSHPHSLPHLPTAKEKNHLNIVLHPGASRSEKEWGLENYFKLSKLISEKLKDIRIVITGSKTEIEKNRLLQERLSKASIQNQNLTGEISFKELLTTIQNSDYFISSDTSIAHLSSLTTTASITIFLGNCYHFHTFPYAVGRIVVYPDIKCYPCNADYLCKDQSCKNLITPEDILSIILKTYKGKNALMTYLTRDGFIKLKNINITQTLEKYNSVPTT